MITKKSKTRVALIVFSIIILSIGLITNVTDNIKKIIENKNELNILEIRFENYIHEEEALKSELIKLSDRDYLARYAKEKYLYSQEGEIIIKFKNN